MEFDKLDSRTLALLTTLSNLMNLSHSARHIEQTYRKAIEEVRDLRISEFQLPDADKNREKRTMLSSSS